MMHQSQCIMIDHYWRSRTTGSATLRVRARFTCGHSSAARVTPGIGTQCTGTSSAVRPGPRRVPGRYLRPDHSHRAPAAAALREVWRRHDVDSGEHDVLRAVPQRPQLPADPTEVRSRCRRCSRPTPGWSLERGSARRPPPAGSRSGRRSSTPRRPRPRIRGAAGRGDEVAAQALIGLLGGCPDGQHRLAGCAGLLREPRNVHLGRGRRGGQKLQPGLRVLVYADC
jgi:hypothetical protein